MKNTTHILCHFGHSTQTKNKLEKAFYDYLKSYDGDLFIATDIDLIIKSITLRAVGLSYEHPKCKPIPAISFEDEPQGMIMRGFYPVNFYIYKAKIVNL